MLERTFRLLLHHPAVLALVAACDAEGVECHLVGGVLRDRALGLPVHDIDAVVPERGRAVAERLAATLPARLVLLGGKEFAAFRLVAEEFQVDLWDRAGMTFDEDLARRDFTVSSFALDARTGAVIDPFDGLGDLRRRILRATTPESFTGDPLRVLRLPRLLIRLPGFAADPDTVELARRAAPLLPAVAGERVRDELTFLFAHPEAHRGLALLIALDLYPGLWLGAPGEPGTSGTAIAELEALPGRILELRQLDALAAEAVDAPIARLASLFANLPPRPGVTLLGDVQRFQMAGYLTRQVSDDVRDALALPEMPDEEIPARRWLHRAGALWSTAACWQGARRTARDEDAAGWQSALRRLVDLVEKDSGTLFDPPRLVTGTEVQELLGLRPGREVGRVLDAILEAQVEGRVRTRAEALEIVRSVGKEKDAWAVVVSNGALELSDGAMETSNGSLAPSDGAMEASNGPLETSNGLTETSGGPLKPSNGAMEPSNDAMETSNEALETSNGPMEVSNGPMEASGDPMEPSDDPLEPSIDALEVSGGPLEPSGGPSSTDNGPS